MIWAKNTKNGIEISIRLIPNATKNHIDGIYGTSLKIRIQAPPNENKANIALIKFLSKKIDISCNQISIVGGQTSRNKRVLIKNTSLEALSKII